MKVTNPQVSRQVDQVLSQNLKKASMAELGDCYRNAFRCLSMLGSPSIYVEGLARIDRLVLPMDHGWIELEDGTILDPTWAEEGEVTYVALYRYSDMGDLLAQVEMADGIMPLMMSEHLASRLTNEEYFAAFKLFSED
jgi:hypothetical protein